jgi:hypothetical protein
MAPRQEITAIDKEVAATDGVSPSDNGEDAQTEKAVSINNGKHNIRLTSD